MNPERIKILIQSIDITLSNWTTTRALSIGSEAPGILGLIKSNLEKLLDDVDPLDYSVGMSKDQIILIMEETKCLFNDRHGGGVSPKSHRMMLFNEIIKAINAAEGGQ
jgi:predicted phage-related endonuclease